jgi:selenocysteine lyase/cysteine desulfurase
MAVGGELAGGHGVVLMVDASQTAGATSISMKESGISVLCFTGHKSMMGPQGTGGLCIEPGVEIKPFKVGGTGVQSYLQTQPEEYPTRLEAGTLNGHGIAGLLAAVEFINETGIEKIENKENRLMWQFYKGVSEIEGIKVYGDFSCKQRSPIVALNIRDTDAAIVADALMTEYGIATRAGAHCAPLMHRALGTDQQGAVRFSFNWYNTEEEVNAAISALRELALTE